MTLKRVFFCRAARKSAVFTLFLVITGMLAVINAASPGMERALAVLVRSGTAVREQAPPVPAAPVAGELSATPPPEAQEKPAGPLPNVRGLYRNAPFRYLDIPLERPLQEYAYARCELLGLEYEMVLAIMWRESLFQPDAVGVNTNGTRDSGLMQINDVNRQWLFEKYGIDDLLDPYQNIDAGTAILAGYFAEYDEPYALMAYQYGESGMLEHAAGGMTTNALTVKVQNKRDEFKAM